jgi:CheY-like chemotaxis protein
MKILVADDDPIIRKLLSEVLTNDGHQVTATTNGVEALEETGRQNFQLVFMDVHMPLMNGLETLLEIREIFPELPVAMMDSYPDQLAHQAKREGALTCIHKPFDLQEIRRIIREVENRVLDQKVS